MAQDRWGPRDPRGSGGASRGRHAPVVQAPRSEEQCRPTPTRWPRATAQGASAGTVTSSHAGGKDWPPGHGRRAAQVTSRSGQPGPAGPPPGSSHTRRCRPSLTPSTKTPTKAEAPVITFPMMLPTSCRKKHRNPTSPAAGAPVRGTRRKGACGGQEGYAARPPVWRPCIPGSPRAHLSAADPGPPLTDGQPRGGAGSLPRGTTRRRVACARGRWGSCTKLAVGGMASVSPCKRAWHCCRYLASRKADIQAHPPSHHHGPKARSL